MGTTHTVFMIKDTVYYIGMIKNYFNQKHKRAQNFVPLQIGNIKTIEMPIVEAQDFVSHRKATLKQQEQAL